MLKGRGTVATGRVEQGIIKVGDEVEVLGLMQVNLWVFFLYLLQLQKHSCAFVSLAISLSW